jgi:hypothetical protein
MVDLTYSANVQPESLPGRAYPRLPGPDPAAYGGQVGQSIEQASGVLQSVQDKIEARALQTQHTDAVNKLTVLADDTTHNPQTGAFTKQGQNAFGLDQQYMPQFDTQANAIVSAIPDARARQAAQQSANQIRAQVQNQLMTHELQQHKEFGIKTDQDAIDIASTHGPANYNDAGILNSSLQTIQLKSQHLADQLGWSPEQTEQFTQQQTSKFHMTVIDRMAADGKFAMADHYLDVTKNQMDAGTAWSARRMIDGQMKEKQNEQKQDIADRLQDSMAAAQYGIKNPVTVSRAELDVLYPKDAQRHWDALQGLVASGATAQDMNKMTPEEAAAHRDAAFPQSGGPETALKIKSYEILSNAYDQSMKARTADPAQFAIENNSWKPLDLSNSQNALANLKSRANTQDQISAQTGVNTPLLSKQETKQFTAWLDNQPPSDRLQALAALRTNLPNDQSYASLLKQVAPGSPVTAIAGSMLDRPAAKATPAWYDPKFAADPTVPQRMLEGEAILRAKDEKGIASKFPMPADKDLQGAFQSAVGGANSDLFRGRPDTLEAIYAAYKASYAAEASHRGVTNGILNSDIAQKAAEGVVGHATNYGNSTVVVPTGMDPTHFEGVMDSASKSALEAGGYSEKDIAALRGYGVRELGDTLGTGRYVIIDGNGDPLKSKTGRNSVVIDLNKTHSQHTSTFTDPDEVPHEAPYPGNMGK